jgi:hypothetical protein
MSARKRIRAITRIDCEAVLTAEDDAALRPTHTEAGSLVPPVNWVRIDVDQAADDADHRIDPDELFRVAMARQRRRE